MVHRLCGLILLVTLVAGQVDIAENQISNDARQIRSGEELLSEIVDSCFGADGGYMTCVRAKMLAYMDTVVPEGRTLSAETPEEMDKEIMERVQRYLKTHEFKVQLPEFFFQGAEMTFRPAKGLANFKVEFPEEDKAEDRSLSKARGVLKKKLLLPILLLLKLKMKALMPILVAVIGLKAMKALVLSKIAILLVVGFLIVQLCKKGGMMMPMAMPMAPEPAMPMPYGPPSAAPPAPSMMYGAPATAPAPAMPYGAPATAPAASPPSSYEPGWEPSNSGGSAGSGGPYSRVWDAHQVAYSAYYNPKRESSQPTSQSQTSSN